MTPEQMGEIHSSDTSIYDKVAAATELWRRAWGVELTLEAQANLGDIILEFVDQEKKRSSDSGSVEG